MSTTHFYTLDESESRAAVANMGAAPEGIAFWALGLNTSPYVPVYRLDHMTMGTHLFTTFIDERDVAVNELQYKGNGIGFWCMPANYPASNVQPLFRLHNATTNDYLFTLDAHEVPKGYKRQGIACSVFKDNSNGSVPLHRYVTPTGVHFYTIDPHPLAKLIAEGTCGYVFPNPGAAPEPLFRSYNTATGSHLYTTDITEHDAASNNNAYRGDGIACYIFGDSSHTGTVPLLRAYNDAVDDRLYTIDAAEHENAISTLGYVDEGVTGWVLSLTTGPLSEEAQPVQRFYGNFGSDFFLSPPETPPFLRSSSNFVLTSEVGAQVNAIVGLDVGLSVSSDVTVTEVDAGDIGMSLQLNAYSPVDFTPGWQQYTISVFKGSVQCEIQNWTKSPYAPGFIVGAATLCGSHGNSFPKGWRLRIALINDEFSNIVGADFYVYRGDQEIGHQQLLVANFNHGLVVGAAPIIAFQLVLVGPYDGEAATLAAKGAGTITYKADVALRATTQLPATVGYPTGTAETSNATYGQIAATKSKLLRQSLGVGLSKNFWQLVESEYRLKKTPP
jgi:hypothetical protein